MVLPLPTVFLSTPCELLLLPFKFAGDFFVLLCEHATTAERIDGAPFGRRHQPQARPYLSQLGAKAGWNQYPFSQIPNDHFDQPRMNPCQGGLAQIGGRKRHQPQVLAGDARTQIFANAVD